MKWLAMIATYFFGRKSHQSKSLKEMAVEIFEELSFHSRRVVTLSMTALGAVFLFCGGFLIALLESTAQYDREGYVALTATLAGGLGLAVVSGLIFSYVFMRAWPHEKRAHLEDHPRREESKTSSPMETALAALIMDIVREREQKRHYEESQTETAPPPSSHRDSSQNTAAYH